MLQVTLLLLLLLLMLLLLWPCPMFAEACVMQ